MITGDNPLTACYVARQLKFCRTGTIIILTQVDGKWLWESVDQKVTYPLGSPATMSKKEWREFITSTDMCLTGEGLSYLLSNHESLTKRLLPHVKVFARVNPKQKEAVVTTLKALGYTTLMCGDGTNDVGALKHSHVGVAILSSLPSKKKKGEEKKEEKENKEDKEKFDKLRR